MEGDASKYILNSGTLRIFVQYVKDDLFGCPGADGNVEGNATETCLALLEGFGVGPEEAL